MTSTDTEHKPSDQPPAYACGACGWTAATYAWTVDGRRTILCPGCAADTRRAGHDVVMGGADAAHR